MANNFFTKFVAGVLQFKATPLNAPLEELDKVITYMQNVIVHCDGDLSYNNATGVLSWSSTLRILFNRADGQAIQNTIATGSITLADNEFFYVDVSETNNTVLTASKAVITTGAASNFKNLGRVVLAYRNTVNDKCYMIKLSSSVVTYTAIVNSLLASADASAVRTTLELGSIATKDFWQGTQVQYDALGTYDNNTIYFITE